MKPLKPSMGTWPTVAVLLAVLPPAFCAPGEDVIVLSGAVSFQSAPMPQAAPSGQIETMTSMPASIQARLARYTAKAYSATAEDGSIYTDADVVTTVETSGLKKVCSQEIGNSSTTEQRLGTRYGPQAREQVVVLRGDLVNICR